MLFHRRFLTGALVLAGLAGLTFAPTASAQTSGNKANKQVYAQLVQAHHLLHAANHDYHGHRIQAAHDVHKAIQILTGAHHKKPSQTVGQPNPAAQAKPPMPPAQEAQGASDQQMRQAAQLLHQALMQLSSVSNHPRAAQAVPLLHQAIHQIEEGLAYSRKHGQPNPVGAAQ